jgi:hypothetical protein
MLATAFALLKRSARPFGPAAPAIRKDRRHFVPPALRVAPLAGVHRSSRFAGRNGKESQIDQTDSMSASRALPCRPEDVSIGMSRLRRDGTYKDKHRSEARIPNGA